MGLYKEHINMCHKNLSSEKICDDFNKFLAEEYHDIHEL